MGELISLQVDKFLNYVCYNPTTYEEMYEYIYRSTDFDEFGISIFNAQIAIWKEEIIKKEIEKSEFFIFEVDDIFEYIKQKSKLFSTNFNTVEQILSHGIDAKMEYTPKRTALFEEDRHRVSTILDYVEPLINGLPVMDGNDYAGEILDSEKMERGATIIQDLYNEYKDFQFDVKALNHPYGFTHRLSVFEHLFDLYNNRVRFIIELINYDSNNESEKTNSTTRKHYNTFADIFTVKDWNKYLTPLTQCTPRLLEYNETDNVYKFIGNKKKEQGCIAQYFKQLKAKGIINSNVNRDELAKVLSTNLQNFKISGSSIDNNSKQYEEIYEKQLFN